MKEPKREVFLYLAEIRDGLVKVGSTRNLRRRLAELRRQFGPTVEIFESASIPEGWGTAQSWELRLKAKIQRPRYLEQIESFDDEQGDGIVRCGGRAERTDVAWKKEMAWRSFEYAENRSAVGVPSSEVIECTRAEATIAFRDLLTAASCGSAMPPTRDDIWDATRIVELTRAKLL
jgi:hypothetical protein